MRYRKDEMQRIFNFEGSAMDSRIVDLMKSFFAFTFFVLAGPVVLFIIWLWANR